MVKSMENGCVDTGKKSTKKEASQIVKESLLMMNEKGTLISVWMKNAIRKDDGNVQATIVDSLGIEAVASVDEASAEYALALVNEPASVTVRNLGTIRDPLFELMDIDYEKDGDYLTLDLFDSYDAAVGVIMPKLTAYPGTASAVAAAALLNVSPLLLNAKDNSEQFFCEGGLLDRIDKTLSGILNVCDNYRETELDKSLLVSGTFLALLSEAYGDCYNGPDMYIPAVYKVLGLIDSVAEMLGYDPDGYILCELKHVASASCDNAAVKPQTIYAKIAREISDLHLNVKSYLDSIPEFITKEED